MGNGLQISRSASVAVRRGSPWVYREGIGGLPRGLENGAAVSLTDEAGRFLANGFWDQDSPIAVRIVSRDKAERFGPELVVRRVAEAAARRVHLRDSGDTDAYRLCHGEGDRLPGVVIDRYASVAVARLDTEAIAETLEGAADAILARLASHGVRALALHRGRGEGGGGSKLTALRGEAPPDRIVVSERGMKMEVDLAKGQKTGAFLDQRENRVRVRARAAGRERALNLFSYAGGFSIAAALGGATKVTSVDLAGAAHATAQRTFGLNGVEARKHAFAAADAFVFLEQAAARKDRFDLIVSDPPSFAPSERAKARALTAYRKLHGACAKLLAPGGIYCASSCSSHVSLEDFMDTLDTEALGRDDLSVLEAHGNPDDHPTLAAWPEGRYLKFVVLG